VIEKGYPYHPYGGFRTPWVHDVSPVYAYRSMMPGVEPVQQQVEKVLAAWEGKPLEGARQMIRKYGLPDGVTPEMLVWYNHGIWKRIIVYRHPVPHNFPMPHPDFLEQTINYAVPPERFDEIAKFDGSVIIDRTKGEVSARCHEEAMNLLTLNLVHDIVTNKRSVEEARAFYAETAVKHSKLHEPTPYTTKLLFSIPENTAFPDVAVVKPRKQ
jgi:hypothetical protein